MYLYWHQLGEIAALHLYYIVFCNLFYPFPKDPYNTSVTTNPTGNHTLDSVVERKEVTIKMGGILHVFPADSKAQG